MSLARSLFGVRRAYTAATMPSGPGRGVTNARAEAAGTAESSEQNRQPNRGICAP
jgi:hypothetical protein